MSVELAAPSDYVEYDRRVLKEISRAMGRVTVIADGGAFPDAIDSGGGQLGGRWVTLPLEVIDRWWRRSVVAMWKGGWIIIAGVGENDVHFQHFEDKRWAESLGLQGSQYEGYWYGTAPIDELTDVQVVEANTPLPRR